PSLEKIDTQSLEKIDTRKPPIHDLELKNLSEDDGEDRNLGRKLGFGEFSDL
ncbi:hypothetical protein ACLOJK_006984, partial [Asimina triloba]